MEYNKQYTLCDYVSVYKVSCLFVSNFSNQNYGFIFLKTQIFKDFCFAFLFTHSTTRVIFTFILLGVIKSHMNDKRTYGLELQSNQNIGLFHIYHIPLKWTATKTNTPKIIVMVDESFVTVQGDISEELLSHQKL